MALEDRIELSFLDMATAEGLAQGMYYEVFDIPTTIVKDDEKEVARWDGKAPLTKEFEALINGIYG